MSTERHFSSRANCRSNRSARRRRSRLMIAQDTGSAIVGPARADLYFGAGPEAGKTAGRFRHAMRFVMLLPKSLDPAARGRTMPVPDARPSEKIAKLFPQVDPLKDAPKDVSKEAPKEAP